MYVNLNRRESGGEGWDGKKTGLSSYLPLLQGLEFDLLFWPATTSEVREGAISFLHISPWFYKIQNNNK